MSIVSETLKKIEKKRELKKGPVDNNQNTGRKLKTFKPLLLVSLGIVLLVIGLIYFLNVNTLKRQLGPDFEKTPLTKNIEQPAVQPVEKPKKEEPESKEKAIKEVDVEKTFDENEINTAEEIDIPPNMELGGVITGQGDSYAIINGKFIRIGEEIDGAKIISIEDNSVTYSFNDKEYTIKMW